MPVLEARQPALTAKAGREGRSRSGAVKQDNVRRLLARGAGAQGRGGESGTMSSGVSHNDRRCTIGDGEDESTAPSGTSQV